MEDEVKRMNGSVKWFSDKLGYGFILGSDEKDYFTHYLSIEKAGAFRTLEKDWPVTFVPSKGEKGLLALKVRED